MKVQPYIIAGGKSSRMGFDKRTIKVKNRSFLELIVEKAEKVTNQNVTLVGNNLEGFSNYRVITDYKNNKGPFSGLIAALQDTNSEWILALAADLPLLSENDLNNLITAIDSEAQIIAYKAPKGIEPLIALYKKEILDTFLEAFNNGELSVQRIVPLVNLKIMVPENPETLKNVNNPSDLEQLGL